MLKIGKVPENVLKRSVLKEIHTKRKEVVLGAGVGEDCAALKLEEDEIFVISTDPITGTVQDIGNLAMHITFNDLASSGAMPIGVMLTILLPEGSKETELKVMMRQVEEMCSKAEVQIMGGHTEVTKAVNQPLISVCGVGKVKEGQLISTAGARPGNTLVVTKWVGLEGTSILAKDYEEFLKQRFSQEFLEKAKKFDGYLSVLPEAKVACSCGVTAMHDVTEGGIFGALWEMAESSNVGLEIDLKSIPIKQETIEISEVFGINPYQLISSGSMLIATENAMLLTSELKKAGIFSVVVGKVTEGNERVLCNGEERRFLEPPKTDELYRCEIDK